MSLNLFATGNRRITQKIVLLFPSLCLKCADCHCYKGFSYPELDYLVGRRILNWIECIKKGKKQCLEDNELPRGIKSKISFNENEKTWLKTWMNV